MAHAARSGWGYRLNYDKAIAEDLKQLALAERHIPLAAVLTKEEREGAWYYLTLEAFLFANVEQRAPLLGLSESDVIDLCWDSELDTAASHSTEEPKPGWYLRLRALQKRLLAEFGEHVLAEPRKYIKKHRADLSRHRRNKVKFG